MWLANRLFPSVRRLQARAVFAESLIAELRVARSLYIDMVKKSVADSIYRRGIKGWPAYAHSMLSPARLDNVQMCVEQVLRDNVPGDLIETGVWCGGATILMRAILKAYGVTDRRVWVADSFAGLPEPDGLHYPADLAGLPFHTMPEFVVPLDEVKANFARYDLLDEQVWFLPGWFRDTLPSAPIQRLAVLRFDGDMYESAMDALTNLYPKLSPGGFLIVDDYYFFPPCRRAVDAYRARNGIDEPIRDADQNAIYWQRAVA